METIYIKNMVCPRCKKVVKDELTNLGYVVSAIQLGSVEVLNDLIFSDYERIANVLIDNGFEIIDNKKYKYIERIKIIIIELINNGTLIDLKVNLSKHLSNELNMEYTYLSSIFSSTEGKTIERFFILLKIEKIKELILYNELSIKQISIKLGYSSLQALSSQFKKVTGYTPSEFRLKASFYDRKSITDL